MNRGLLRGFGESPHVAAPRGAQANNAVALTMYEAFDFSDCVYYPCGLVAVLNGVSSSGAMTRVDLRDLVLGQLGEDVVAISTVMGIRRSADTNNVSVQFYHWVEDNPGGDAVLGHVGSVASQVYSSGVAARGGIVPGNPILVGGPRLSFFYDSTTAADLIYLYLTGWWSRKRQ